MSATEVIEQIKSLPQDERRKMFAFVHQCEQSTPASGSAPGATSDPEFEAAAKWAVKEHGELLRRLAQ